MLSSWHLSALETSSTLKIYHNLFASILKKTTYAVYTDNTELRDAFSRSNRIRLSASPERTDIVVASKRSTVSQANRLDKVTLVTKYSLLRGSPTAIGALYWRKGRSQLVFVKSRLKHFSISLPAVYRRFILDKL